MKLTHKGTFVDNRVGRQTLDGKEYLVLEVSYNEDVGSAIWFFYIDPNTYALDVYQFFKTDGNGKLKPDTGAYILLIDVSIINTIKIPKNSPWYYN